MNENRFLGRSVLTACVLVFACGSAATASDPYQNVKMRANFPEYDYCFQDKRSIHDILTGRLPHELADSGDPDEPGVFAACYDRDNPPSAQVMAQLEAAMRGGYQDRYNADSRWSRVGQGQPLSLTWSFVPDGTVVGDSSAPGGAGASVLFSRMDTLFGNNRTLWISKFQQVFDRWHALAGVTYTRVTSGGNAWDDGAAWGNGASSTRGDVRIGMKNIDGTNGILAYNQFPDNGDMVIDSSENWGASANDYRFFRDVAMHEHGHGLGLSHVCPLGSGSGTWKLMEPFVNTAYDGPQSDDIRGAQRNYGDPLEPNDASSQATDMGTLVPGTAVNLGNIPSPTPGFAALLSIDNTGDTDWFKFTIDRPRLINVTVTPVGTTYQDAPQDANCAGDGTSTNSLAIANLNFELINAGGTRPAGVYRLVDATAAGAAETTSGVLVSGGYFFVRVSAAAALNTQSYKLSVTAQTTTFTVTASDNTFTDKVRVTWSPVISDASEYSILRSTTTSTLQGTSIGTVAGNVTQFDDTTAVPGQTYYYWVRCKQPGSATLNKYLSETGEAGSRMSANQPPVANAGPDFSVTDSDYSGSESVALDGSASTDPDGTITNYRWMEGANVLSTGPAAIQNVSLPVGVHTITLTVTDSGSATDDDTVVVTVNPPCPADFNGDGGVDGGDVEAFFTAWEQGDASSDVNQDGGVDGSDVATFFVAWENGGC